MKQLIAILPILFTGCALDATDDASSSTEQATTTLDVYNTIRAQEASFPLPTPRADATIGTYNVTTGAYSGLQTTTTYIIDPNTGKPRPMTYTPSISINAVSARLVFNLTNHTTQPVSLTVGSNTVYAPRYATSIAIEVIGNSATWTLHAGSYTRTDTVRISRPYIVGAGVFTVPAMPVTIVYEPPQPTDATKKNTVTYTSLTSLTNKFSMAITDDNSTTRDADPQQYDDLAAMEGAMDSLKTALGYASDVPNKSAVIAAMGVISDAVGTVSGSQTQGMSTSTGSDLAVTDSFGETFTTNSYTGPGKGDRILYLTNARFVWLCDRGVLSIALLGYDGQHTDVVTTLQADLAAIGTTTNLGPTTHLPADSLRGLLALDPFVAGGPGAYLDPTRFVPVEGAPFAGTGGTDTFTITHAVSASDSQATSAFTQLITDERAGWLAFAGIGVTDTAKISTKTTHSENQTTTNTQSVSTQLTMTSPYSITPYYDRVFGGFAVVNTP
jgi:hypothetical protein